MIKSTRPLMKIVDKDGKLVRGCGRCGYETEALEKISGLPEGTYYIERPPIKVVVKA